MPAAFMRSLNDFAALAIARSVLGPAEPTKSGCIWPALAAPFWLIRSTVAVRVGWRVSAVAHFRCQKTSWFLQLDPMDHPLTLRVRHRPSGPAPVGPQGQRVGK